MTSKSDLERGVEQGIITPDQLNKLASIVSEDGNPPQIDPSRDVLGEAEDEAPRFIRSFGDLFIAIGTGFLGAGVMSAVSFLGNTIAAQVAALALIWLAAEWLTGYLRISAPSIVLSVLFTGFSAYFMAMALDAPRWSALAIYETFMIVSATALVAASLLFLRFRLPFALAIVGLTIVGLAFTAIGVMSSDFLLSNFRWIIGLGGLSLFVTAMWFDFKDPLRNSTRSDCGFWLHLIAAPMLTHAVLWDSHPAITNLQKTFGAAPVVNSWMIIAIFFVLFGIIALIINRRALLVSSLGYVGSVIAYGIWQLNLPSGSATSIVLLIIAALILIFGVGWKPLRRLVFKLMPSGKYLDNLPPAHA